jgi:hypothetical protein
MRLGIERGPGAQFRFLRGLAAFRPGGVGVGSPLRATYAIRAVINGGTIRCPRK